MTTVTQNKVKCQLDKIKKGSVLSNTLYLTVEAVGPNSITVKDQTGLTFAVNGKQLIEGMNSADQFTETKTVSMTEAASVLENAGDTVFMCSFNKMANEETVAEALGKLSVTDLTTPKTLKKHLKSLLVGEERILVGHLINSEAKLGRSSVVDLNIAKGQHNVRLIDHRQINFIVIKGVKYIVK